jgi:glycine cleavage system H protein
LQQQEHGGMTAPRKYAKTHEWVAVENGIATVGITDFAVKLLSDLVYIDLPKPGTVVKAGETLGEVESVKAVSDVYAPVSGEIVEVNAPLADHLEWLSQEPTGKGWMVKLKLSDAGELAALLDEAAYQAHCAAEKQ